MGLLKELLKEQKEVRKQDEELKVLIQQLLEKLDKVVTMLENGNNQTEETETEKQGDVSVEETADKKETDEPGAGEPAERENPAEEEEPKEKEEVADVSASEVPKTGKTTIVKTRKPSVEVQKTGYHALIDDILNGKVKDLIDLKKSAEKYGVDIEKAFIGKPF